MVNNWDCRSCKSYNDILTVACYRCNLARPTELQTLAILMSYHRSGIRVDAEELLRNKTMTEREELYKEIFARDRIVAVTMTPIQRKEWRERLQLIAFEAKVSVNAIDDADREERAKVNGESRNWLISSDYSEDVEASINTIKERKARQTKADKLLEQLKSLGIEGAEEIVAQVEKKATGNAMNSISNSLPTSKTPRVKLITSELCRINRHVECNSKFRDDKGSQTCECECHKRAAEINAKPFDINNPFGL